MEKKIKIMANYLPQYHQIPENDKWWGAGFTDWVAVKKAQPLFKNHLEPKVPLNGYYDLSRVEDIRSQIEMANKYGIYGFAIYHYWFNSNLNLLQKPAEIILDNKDLDTHFLFLWDNQSWIRTWSKLEKANDWAPDYDSKEQGENAFSESGILAKLDYGNEHDWKTHFDWLLPFFKDDRYVKINNKPVFGFFNACKKEEKETQLAMVACWDRLARENGFAGIHCMGRVTHWKNNFSNKFLYSPFVDASILNAAIHKIANILKKNRIRTYSYDSAWKVALNNAAQSDEKTIVSGFVNFDDSPRRGEKGRILIGATPEKFYKYMTRLINIARKQNKEYIFLTAWNEWGEGAYLEPDEENGYAYLEALKRAIDSVDTEKI